MKHWVWVSILLLIGCTVKHVPSEFAPHFAVGPKMRFRTELISNQKKLEAQSDLTAHQKRRLRDLYKTEMRSLDKKSDRYQVLKEKVTLLQRQMPDYFDRLASSQRHYRQRRRSARRSKPRRRRAQRSSGNPYRNAYKKYNGDENEAALRLVDAALNDVGFQRSANDDERVELWYLRFRIALDLGEHDKLEHSYKKLSSLRACGYETAQAGFVLSLIKLGSGDSKRAAEIFFGLCDLEDHVGSSNRFLYWKGRMRAARGESDLEEFHDLGTHLIPGYYSLLARNRIGKDLVEVLPSKKLYLKQELSVPSKIDELWTHAELALKNELRLDAAVFLKDASSRLLPSLGESDFLPALYTAHLLQAAGQHLKALQIYYVLADYINREGAPDGRSEDYSFFTEMYPRAYENKIHWNSRLWGVNPDFVYAIIRQESSFVPVATSSANARGLMQMMPFLGEKLSRDWGYKTYFKKSYLWSVDENLKLAIFHLFQLFKVAPHPVLVACAYNAGIVRTRRWWQRFGHFPTDIFVEVIPVKETRKYARRVSRNFVYYTILGQRPFDFGALLPSLLPKFPAKD